MFSFSSRIRAFLMAAYIFFAGLAYGNEPIKVEYTAKVVTEERAIVVTAEVTNVGRPYIGSTDDCPSIEVYKMVDGEKVHLKEYSCAFTADMPQQVIVKHGEVRHMQIAYFLIVCDPGEYTVEVQIEHSDKVFTDTVML